MLSLVGVVTAVSSKSIGEVGSTTNELIYKVSLLPPLSVTVIVQFEYVPSYRELKVIVLLPALAAVSEEEQEPL